MMCYWIPDQVGNDERGRGGVFEKGDKNLLLFDLFCV